MRPSIRLTVSANIQGTRYMNSWLYTVAYWTVFMNVAQVWTVFTEWTVFTGKSMIWAKSWN